MHTEAVKIVRKWALKRARAGMTLTGERNGAPVRIPEIKTVRADGGSVLAQSKDEEIFILQV